MTTPADTDHLSSPDEPLYPRRPQPTPAYNSTADVRSLSPRGVVVRERGGTPFRQIFWSRNGAPANIVGHRWNANTEASRQITSYSLGWPSISLFSGPNCPQTRNLASKISKKISWGDTSRPPQREGRPPLAPPPARLHSVHGGRKLPRCWDLGLGNRSPKSKIPLHYTTPLLSASSTHALQHGTRNTDGEFSAAVAC